MCIRDRYAREQGVALKGDIPIGISRNSVEAWTEPYYFNLNGQAGAPPDDLSLIHILSQNLSEREVLHVSPCYRVSEPPLRGYISDTDLLSGAGELPFAVHGDVYKRQELYVSYLSR